MPALPPESLDDHSLAVLRLTLTPGLGPVLIDRLIREFGGPEAALGATAAALRRVRGIGPGTAEPIARGLADSAALVEKELALAGELGVTLAFKGREGYPELLAQLPDSPPLLYVRGDLATESHGRYPVAIVGSRRCTAYGVEQAERFAGLLARSGLTIVSGGARGIDTAAHRGALRAEGRTVAVLGCGLGHIYPPENAELFAAIADRGAIVSELPLETPPTPDNFPARNRIISGLSLGVLVIEAGIRSGALITARMAGEDHGREVMAIPGRVDSEASQGSLSLLKEGGAALVVNPGDVLSLLESPARHHHGGSHAARYGGAPPRAEAAGSDEVAAEMSLTPEQQAIVEALASPATIDQLVMATSMPPHLIRAELTVLEMQRRIRREGPIVARTR